MRLPSSHLDARRNDDQGTMTPMIDIVFLLLVFFVVAAAGQVQESFLPTELSASGAIESPAEPLEKDPWIVEVWLKLMPDTVTGKTVVDMNGTIYEEIDRLREQLRALAEISPDNPVILDIAPDIPLEDVIDVYDSCRESGFESVNFAADADAVGPASSGGA
ncbi:biopolymer transporter ExbD [Maioricimonas sp. JC845]|uniref:ExbD/TolR family protein n=1 Tax=Maioricimonas sp. JC845 TaxID=3232138 RepID=UPI00345814AA